MTEVTGGTGADQTGVGNTAHSVENVIGAIQIDATDDMLTVDDSATSRDATWSATATAITRTGSGSITYEGAAEVSIIAGSGSDELRIQGIAAFTIARGGDGNDIILVSSDAPANLGNLDGLTAALTVSGGNGTDRLELGHLRNFDGSEVVLDASSISGLVDSSIDFSSLESVGLQLGSGDDSVTVINTHSGTTFIDAFGGNDSLQVGATSGDLSVELGNGADTVQAGSTGGVLNDLAGRINLDAGGGIDGLTFDDSGDQESNAGTWSVQELSGFGTAGIQHQAFENLELLLGSGDDHLQITGTSVPAVIDGGAGNDPIEATDSSATVVGITVFGASGDDTLTGGSGDDLIDGSHGNDVLTGNSADDTIIGGSGNDQLDGSDGTDTLIVVENGSIVMTPTDVIGVSRDLHTDFEAAVFEGGAGNDRLDASQVSFPVTLTGNSGDDTLVGSSSSGNQFTGGPGIDKVELRGTNIVLRMKQLPT